MTQPWATVIAAGLAIVAAGIAFVGVLHAQAVAKSATRAQLRQQHAALVRQGRQHAAQLAATANLEREKHRRQVSTDAVKDGLAALSKLKDAYAAAGSNPGDEHARDRCTAAADECTVAASMLLLLDLDAPYQQILAANTLVRQYLRQPPRMLQPAEIHGYSRAHTDAVDALRTSFQEVLGHSPETVRR
ncbi:hypothetical protein ACFVMC_05125 [Nocardia sp. NPDC127579]|uniref:hypothetical protein n=1 Tax=Nocardia sp. NPDC127579 TaxID=3345402 RepID=UPI0036427578